MIIEAINTFKHDIHTFEGGKKYDLPEGAAQYFIANGWAKSDGGEALPLLQAEHVLEIQDAALGVTSA